MRRHLRAQAMIAGYLLAMALSGFGVKVKAGALSWAVGKAETLYAKPALGAFLALSTVEVKYSMTGATITEPAEIEGYKRKEVKFAEAVEGETAEIYNEAEEVFPAWTGAGSATIISWGLVKGETSKAASEKVAAAGPIIAFGSCTSTVISKTQSPPTVAAKALKIELK